VHLLGDLLLLDRDDDELSDRSDHRLRNDFDGTRDSSRFTAEDATWNVEFSSVC